MTEPLRIAVKRRPIHLPDFKARHAEERDCDTLLDGQVILEEAGQPVMAQLRPTTDFTGLIQALRSIEYRTNYRTGTMKTRSRIFGYTPRIAIRQDYCSNTSLAWEEPAAHQEAIKVSKALEDAYRQLRPDVHAAHLAAAQRVRPEYRIEEGLFTSGIINYNNPLPYHHDKGNVPGAWSAMLVFKKDVAGGHLSVPEYGVRFALPDASLFLFNGSEVLHGVTPIKQTGVKGYRYSLVYYTLKGMWQCLSPTDEVKRIQAKRTEREQKRRDGVPTQGATVRKGDNPQ